MFTRGKMGSENKRTSKLVQHAQTKRQAICQKAWALDNLRTTCRRELRVQEVADPFVFSFPYRDYPPRSYSPLSSDAVELPPISRFGVAAWSKTKRVKEGG